MVEIGESNTEQKEIAGEIFDGYIEALRNEEAPVAPLDLLFIGLEDAGITLPVEEQQVLLKDSIKEKLGVDISKLKESKLLRVDIVVDGVKGQPSEDGGRAMIYETKEDGIFLKVTDYINPQLGRQYDLVTDLEDENISVVGDVVRIRMEKTGKTAQETLEDLIKGTWDGDPHKKDYEALLEELNK